MKILLISPNTLTVPYPVYPIGLDYVAGSLAAHHQVRIADLLSCSMEELADVIRDFSPDVLGIAIRNIDNTDASDPYYSLNEYKNLVAWLRTQSPAIIVCGGSGFTIMPEQVLALLAVDYGIIGEGERFALFIEALEKHSDPLAVPGVIRLGSAAVSPGPWPGRQRRLFMPKSGHVRYYLEHGGMLNVQTKRGCSFGCSYCPYPKIEGRQHRLHKPEEIAEIVRQLKDAGARYLFFTDSAFNSDIDHSMAVARAMIEANVTLPWGAFFAPIKMPDAYFPLMAQAGCRHVEFGTESLSAAMLKSYRKPFHVEDVFIAHEQARTARLHVAHYLLLGGVGESAETIDESLDGLDRLSRTVVFFFTGVRIYPGTAIHATAVAEGKIAPDQNLLSPVFYQPDAIGLKEIEMQVRQRAAGRINWVIGSGGEEIAQTTSMLHLRGMTGPLWEHIIR